LLAGHIDSNKPLPACQALAGGPPLGKLPLYFVTHKQEEAGTTLSRTSLKRFLLLLFDLLHAGLYSALFFNLLETLQDSAYVPRFSSSTLRL
jgi:hypothetical protein